MRLVFIALGIALCSHPGSAAAQPFVGGALVVSWQPAGTGDSQNPSVVTNGIGGTAAGVGVMAGAFLTPRIAVEGEVTLPSRFEGLQVATKYQELNSHRDIIVSGLLRIRSVRRGPEFVAGLSWVREDTLRQVALRNFLTFDFPPFEGSPQPITRDTWGYSGGVDLPIAFNQHISVTPQIRVHWIARGDLDPNFMVGLSSVVWRPAVAVIASF